MLLIAMWHISFLQYWHPGAVLESEEMKMMILIREYGTGRMLASIHASELNSWCDDHGYLPHHKCVGGWVVIAA